MLFVFSLSSHAQSWSSILSATQAINWSNSGVGGIPARTTNCASLTSSATVSQINSALASCPSGQTVALAAGTYSISGTIQVPSNVTLRGAGANQTILSATGGGGGYVVALGSGGPGYNPVNITGGATNGSTSITLSNASGITTSSYLVIAETNNPAFVSSNGSEGQCTWCDGWTSSGSLARGQIVQVTAVSGSTVTISPGLYGAYTQSPIAVPFNMSASYAGVENLQVYANNTGYAADFGLSSCAYCWVKGVEGNYTDGDQLEDYWGYRDEIRDSYFSNAYLHEPGTYDSDVRLALQNQRYSGRKQHRGTRPTRHHDGVGRGRQRDRLQLHRGRVRRRRTQLPDRWYQLPRSPPQYNLLEGNTAHADLRGFRVGNFQPDYGLPQLGCRHQHDLRSLPVAGARSAVRRLRDSRRLEPCNGRISRPTTTIVGNVVGSTQMQSLIAYGDDTMGQVATVEYPATRSYDADAYGWSFGYGEAADDGSGTGCDGTKVPAMWPEPQPPI